MWVNSDGVSLDRIATTAPITQNPPITEERPKKEAPHPAYLVWYHNIFIGIVALLFDVGLQRRNATVAIAGGRHR